MTHIRCKRDTQVILPPQASKMVMASVQPTMYGSPFVLTRLPTPWKGKADSHDLPVRIFARNASNLVFDTWAGPMNPLLHSAPPVS